MLRLLRTSTLSQSLTKNSIKLLQPSLNLLKPFSTFNPNLRKADLTINTHPHLIRNDSFKKLEITHLDYFQTILNENQMIVSNKFLKKEEDNNNDLDKYNTDWLNKYKGQSCLILKPNAVDQVSDILKYCNENKLAVVPQGGNTGLVGGSVPIFDEIILSLENLNKIRNFDKISGILTCDAGCILESLNSYVEKLGYIMPLDLGAKGSCHIGGNLATNAGGLRLLRYGSLHGTVLGVEAVLADGTILDSLSTLRKDNTGYDVKQLFIGSEGTLGVITGVSILTPQAPKAVNVAVFGVKSFDMVQKAFRIAREQLSEILSAFELIDHGSLELVKLHASVKSPLDNEFPFYLLIETHGSNKEHDDQKLEGLLQTLMEDGIVEDGVVAQDQTQANKLWHYREYVPEAVALHGTPYKYDFSVPLPNFYDLVLETKQYLYDQKLYNPKDLSQSKVKAVVGFGHVGDGNLHLNIVGQPNLKEKLEPFVFEMVAKYQGSISAEHGMGLQKAKHLHYSKPQPVINIMKNIKKVFDPNNILNPYKTLP